MYYMEEQLPAPGYGTEIGSFTTFFSTKDKPRVNNLNLASESINNTIIYPGGVFSYNEALGPTTKENGYQKAKIIVKGIEKKGFGGGVCQVSSTLYNAAEMAGMEIVERHPHSKKVLYVEEDRDAATSHGTLDLKIKNTYDFPVRIISYIFDGSVTVIIEII